MGIGEWQGLCHHRQPLRQIEPQNPGHRGNAGRTGRQCVLLYADVGLMVVVQCTWEDLAPHIPVGIAVNLFLPRAVISSPPLPHPLNISGLLALCQHTP